MWFRGSGVLAFVAAATLSGVGCHDDAAGVPADDAGDDDAPDASVPAPCVEVAYEAGDVTADVLMAAEIGSADVLFLMDVTGSMSQEIDNLQAGLRDDIVPGLLEMIPDVGLGVAYFADFAVGDYGLEGDVPFVQLSSVSTDPLVAQAGVDLLPVLDGNDGPEAQVEALYQLATGEGLGTFVPQTDGCPSGGAGYACFRRESLPIILMFTDAPFHNGPNDQYPYQGIAPAPHTWQQAVDALGALGAAFIGLDSAGIADLGGVDDLGATARALGTVDGDGDPLVFDVGDDGARLTESVLEAVGALTSDVRVDVDAIVEDVPGDDHDSRELVQAIRPATADPADGVQGIDETSFRAVTPGTRLTFALTIRNDAIEPGPEPIVVPVRVVFRANGTSTLAVRIVDIVVPGLDGSACPVDG